MTQKYKGEERFSFIPSLLQWLCPLLSPCRPAHQHLAGEGGAGEEHTLGMAHFICMHPCEADTWGPLVS